MFKSIFGRMFWTYAVILVILFLTIAVTISALFSQFTERKQIETLSSVVYTIEDWTLAMHVEQQDELSRRAYNHALRSWSKFTDSDIIIINRNGEVFESTRPIKSVPNKVLESISQDKITSFKSDFDEFYPERVLCVSYPMHYKNTPIGAIIVRASIRIIILIKRLCLLNIIN